MPPQNNQQTPISMRSIGSNGLILDTSVSESLMPVGAVSWCVNMHFDAIGEVTTRDGVTILGAQLVDNKSILGLHQALDTGSGTNDRLIAAVDTTWKALVSGAWTDKRTGLTADSKARFTNFVDYVFGVNGVDAMQSWDMGAGNFSTTNVTSAPAATFIDNFRTRVWAARTTTNPSRLYYSSVADASYAILWTGSDSSYIDISPLDGEDITGIKKFGSALHVFKNSYIYRVYSINQTEPDPQIFVGTYSQESISVAKDGMYWHHPSGIYKLSPGSSNPIEISRPIYDIIKNISRTYYDDVCSWTDDDHVYFGVGDISIYGITLNNCVLRWTISTQVWTVYKYAHEFTVGATYDTGSAIVRVVGDNDGNVHTFNSGKTDNGTTISYELESRWLILSGLRSELKTIRKMVGIHENMEGATVGWRNGTMGRNQIEPCGQLESQQTLFDNQSIQGNRLKLSVRGQNSGLPAIFQGFEILDYLNEGIIRS